MSDKQQTALAQVGVPLDLHRVGGVEALDGVVGVVEQQAHTGVAVEVRDA